MKEVARLTDIDPKKVEQLTAHRLRGTFISDVAREFGIYAASKAAGHSNLATTQLYLEDGDLVTEDIIEKRSSKFSSLLENN